jgi:hypothetical protein
MACLAAWDLDDGRTDDAGERLAAALALVPQAEDWELHPLALHELMEVTGHLSLARGDALGAAEVCGALAEARRSNPNLQLPYRQRELNSLMAAAMAAADDRAIWERWQHGRRATAEQQLALTEELGRRHAGARR